MTNQLIRATTYFDPDILLMLKKQAVEERKPFYAVLNDRLGKKKSVAKKAWRYEDVFGAGNLTLRKKDLKRQDYYE